MAHARAYKIRVRAHIPSWYAARKIVQEEFRPFMKANVPVVDHAPGSKVLTRNKHLIRWVEKMAELCRPAAIHWVDGSQKEYDWLCDELVAAGTFTRLNQKLWPGCFYARSDPQRRGARGRPHIYLLPLEGQCRADQQLGRSVRDAAKLKGLFNGAMRGRTMYVLPFSMGPMGSPMSRIGVQLTDSPYVVVNMRIMARIGSPVFAEIDKDEQARGAVHAFGGHAAEAGPAGCALALQRRKVHCAFSGDARDLVLRIGLRRQCAAGQEMLCAAHCVEHCARRRLDGRAHADSGRGGADRARRRMWRRRFRRPAEKPTLPCWFRPRR